MNAMIQVTAAAVVPPRLRDSYLDGLAEPQELFVETMVARGSAYIVTRGPRTLGYGVVCDDSVVEFFMTSDEGLATLPDAYVELLRISHASRALVKTFDPLMASAAATVPARTRVEGYLFRQVSQLGAPLNPQVRITPATPSDLSAVWEIHDGFFQDHDEFERYASSGGAILYSNDEGLLGCGVLARVVANREAVDLGMVVAPAHRQLGYGAMIATHLKELCLLRGDRPVCGCDVGNEASRRALQSAGFSTAHRLIEFAYDPDLLEVTPATSAALISAIPG